VRWGLLSYAVAHFFSTLLIDLPATTDASAWYFGDVLLLLGVAVGLVAWGFYTSLGGRLWDHNTLS
jgi:hypothetical protein